jgi:hypothetical protein
MEGQEFQTVDEASDGFCESAELEVFDICDGLRVQPRKTFANKTNAHSVTSFSENHNCSLKLSVRGIGFLLLVENTRNLDEGLFPVPSSVQILSLATEALPFYDRHGSSSFHENCPVDCLAGCPQVGWQQACVPQLFCGLHAHSLYFWFYFQERQVKQGSSKKLYWAGFQAGFWSLGGGGVNGPSSPP